MDKIKVSAQRRSEPNLQKLARALLSMARRQVAATAPQTPESKPPAGKDAA